MNAFKIDLRTTFDIPEDQLLALYDSVGWKAYTTGAARQLLLRAIQNSTYVVSAWKGDRLVGLGRGLSDDVSIFYLQDILVHPDDQRQGIGSALLLDCLNRFRHVRTIVLLTDDRPEQLQFYESMGFTNTRDPAKVTLNTFVMFREADSPSP